MERSKSTLGRPITVILAAAAHNMSRAQKRSRFVEDTGRKLKKRRKVQNSPSAATTVVSHDNLQWREVAVPDRLEDAEGFLGLGIEEIEDVEVIKDPKSSRVQFRVKSS
jgi:ATP-dependent RNA helicase DDX24/MAK5